MNGEEEEVSDTMFSHSREESGPQLGRTDELGIPWRNSHKARWVRPHLWSDPRVLLGAVESIKAILPMRKQSLGKPIGLLPDTDLLDWYVSSLIAGTSRQVP